MTQGYSTTDPAAASSASASGALQRGQAVGRYTILGLLGKGGMGEVYAARDPELERDLAVKILRTDVGGSSMGDRGRFMREAQALARLSHPNVVAVYDVGTIGEEVFVAMEKIDGVSLADWIKERPRGWREVREIFLAAGRGLEAAHALGIVHRDFKPHNVMVGAGRVVVLDFGLARRAGDAPGSGRAKVPVSLSLPLTEAGSLLGTPAYMAPELFAGATATEASDQFSFAISLHEALYGGRPERVAKTHAVAPLPDDAGRGVPRWLAAICARGLALDPTARYASMTELLAALGRDPGRRLRVGLAVAAAVAALGVTSASVMMRAPPPDPCATARGGLEGIWDDGARATLRAAFARIERPFSADAFARTAAILDAQAAALTAMRGEVCAATVVRGEQSPALMDLRMLCLNRRRGELRALVSAFSHDLDAQAAAGAVEAAARLSPVAVCADATALAARVPLPDDPATRADVLGLQDQVATVEALVGAGKLSAAAGLAPVIARASASTYAPLRARAHFAAGIESYDRSDYEAARRHLELAIEEAGKGKDDVTSADAWLRLLAVRMNMGHNQQVLDLGLPAREAVRRAGDDLRQQAELEGALANASARVGRHAEARLHLGRALAAARAVPGAAADHALALALFAALTVYQVSGDYTAGRAAAVEYHAAAKRAYGPQSFRTANARMAIANVDSSTGRVEDALAGYLEALAIFEVSQGTDTDNFASVLYNLGIAEEKLGHGAKALAYYERALVILERIHGRDHVMVANAILGLNTSYRLLGRTGDARAALLRAWEMYRRLGSAEDSLDIINIHLELGELAKAEGDWRECLKANQTALRLLEGTLGETNAMLPVVLLETARARRQADGAGAAIADLERALTILGLHDAGPRVAAEVRWELAGVLTATRRNAARARALATDAEVAFREVNDHARADEVAAWLARR